MTASQFLVGPIKDGMRKDVRPFAIPEDAFLQLTNAYQFRGRIVRRSGYIKLGRLQLEITIDPAPPVFLVGDSINLKTQYSLDPTFTISPGTIKVTVGANTYTDPSFDGVLVGTPGGSGTIDYSTGILTIVGGGASQITGTFFYNQNLPVMGLRTQEGFNIDIQSLIAFDTTQAYLYNGGFGILPSVMPVTWHGKDYQFFFTTNYAGAFWSTNNVPGINGWKISAFTGQAGLGAAATVQVTTAVANTAAIGDSIYFANVTGAGSVNNLVAGTVTIAGNPFTVKVLNTPSATFVFQNGIPTTGIVLDSTQAGIILNAKPQDGIRYYGDLTNGTSWANYNPPIDSNNVLAGALMIFPYRGYLVFLNTWEGNENGVQNFPNRARWTEIGTPYYSPPTPQTPNIFGYDINACRDDLFGRGGANDAPTGEVIVSANFIRDILIVYFERSTWRLRFVNNAQNPFVWERVNIELGSDCTFSALPFDKGLMAISNRGITISDGNDTIRFDEKIPDEIFNIRQSNNGLERVYGIRTFKTRLNFWTYPSSDNPESIYPDKVLVFNYDTKNWSFFDDSFTCFGYYYPSGKGYTWGDLPDAWSSYSYISWNSGISEGGFENVIAGNQQGYVLILEAQGSVNQPSMFISAITTGAGAATFTSTNNNFADGDWITISGVVGVTSSDGVKLNGRNFTINNPNDDPNDFTLSEFKSIDGGTATGTSYTYTISYQNIIAGSIQIDIGTLVFTDPGVRGILVGTGGSGTIDYTTGKITLSFNPAIAPTQVWVRIVTLDTLQGLSVVSCIGTYAGGGEIAKISNVDIQTKIFNFFNDDKRSRLSKVDFYVDSTVNGQFTCNVLGDSSNFVLNEPLPENPQSNVVLTSTNPFQFGIGTETIYRLYCDAIAQTVQLQLTLSDAQMATNPINSSDIQILSMMFTLKRGGRIV